MAEGESRKFDDLKQEPVRPQPEKFVISEENDLSGLDIIDKDFDETQQPQTKAEPKPDIEDFQNDLDNKSDLTDRIQNLADPITEPVQLDQSTEAYEHNLKLADENIFGPAAFHAGTQAHENIHRMKGSGADGSLEGLTDKDSPREIAEERERRKNDKAFKDYLMMQAAADFAEGVRGLAEDFNELDPKVDGAIESAQNTVSTLRGKLRGVMRENTDALMEASDLGLAAALETDPEKKRQLEQQYEEAQRKADLLSAKSQLFKDICGKDIEELEEQAKALDNQRDALKEEIEDLDRKRIEGTATTKDQRRLQDARQELSQVETNIRNLEENVERALEISEEMETVFTNDNVIDQEEMQRLVRIAGTEGRQALENYAAKIQSAGVNIAGLTAESANQYWDWQYELYDIEKERYELQKQLDADPNNLTIQERINDLDLKKLEIENEIGLCLAPDYAHLQIAQNTEEYQSAHAAYTQATNELYEATDNTIEIFGGSGLKGLTVYKDQNGEYYVRDLESGESVLVKDQHNAEELYAEIATQEAEGKTFGTAEIAQLEDNAREASQNLDRIKDEQLEKTYTSAADEYDTPGEPLEESISPKFTAAAGELHGPDSPTTIFNPDADAANDPVFNQPQQRPA